MWALESQTYAKEPQISSSLAPRREHMCPTYAILRETWLADSRGGQARWAKDMQSRHLANVLKSVLYSYVSVLQCIAVCCSVLQCVAVCCSVLQCVAVCCSVAHILKSQLHSYFVQTILQRADCWTLCCSVLQCVAAFLPAVATRLVIGQTQKFSNVSCRNFQV